MGTIGDTPYLTTQGHVVADSNYLTGITVRREPRYDAEYSPHQRRVPAHPTGLTPRLRLKPKAHQSGFVDGASWPHSEDLTAELTGSAVVLSVPTGQIDRVIYNMNEWATPPSKFVVGGHRVRLDGYPIEALLGIVGPDLAPDLLGKSGERQQIRAGRVEVLGDLG
ncbi:DUF5994 family protein [Candidatus Mycobacterium methanotrophicum]|uniref:DUF5994 family protein n=1 Tax=Candidatus Mycobacterium methanotrophicum TaxID=2943498 RepID=A0ABY4QHJ6_9MYCO|nr:DUF5994 family protein [Candidatus Mycobacterium methanotrophicum]UQX09962.1 DUF5994 family protein [Candidatus Mycobacterium methanotrophicum]